WSEARWQLLDVLTSGGQVALQVETADGMQRERTLHLEQGTVEPDGADLMAEAGLQLAAPKPRVNEVNAGQPGEQAGLRAGDIVVRVGDLQNPGAGAMVTEIQKHAGVPLPLTVLRDGAPLDLMVTPQGQPGQDGQTVGRIGVILGADFPMVTVRYGLFDSLTKGVTRTV